RGSACPFNTFLLDEFDSHQGTSLMTRPTGGSPMRCILQEAMVKAVTAWSASPLRPIVGFRRSYLPLVMVYFAYGALGIIDVSRDMWVKERLTLPPAELA